eukprot:gene31045-39967_t
MSPSRPNTPFQSSSSLASSSAAQSPPKVGVFQSFHMRALAIIVLTVVVHTVITWNWVQTGGDYGAINNQPNRHSSAFGSSSVAASFVRDWLFDQAERMKDPRHLPILTTPATYPPFSVETMINVWDLAPPTVSCPDAERVGKVGEGGKWVCGLSHLSRLEHCVMYSYGISTDVSFEWEILRRTN